MDKRIENNKLLNKKDKIEYLSKYITLNLNNENYFMNDFIEILNKYEKLFQQEYFIIKNCNFILSMDANINMENQDKSFEFYFLDKIIGSNLKLIFENCSFYFINENYFETFYFNFENYMFNDNNNFYFLKISEVLNNENDMLKSIINNNNKTFVSDINKIRSQADLFLTFFATLNYDFNNENVKFYIPQNILIILDYNFFNSIVDEKKFLLNSKVNFKNVFLEQDRTFFLNKTNNIKNLSEFNCKIKNDKFLANDILSIIDDSNAEELSDLIDFIANNGQDVEKQGYIF